MILTLVSISGIIWAALFSVAKKQLRDLQAEAVKRHYAEWRVNQDTQEVTFVWVEEKAK